MDWVDVGGLGVSVTGVLLSLEAAVVWIVELDNESTDSFPGHFHANQHSSAAIGQPIEHIDVVHQHHLTPYLQLELCHKGCVYYTSCTILVEGLHCLACILGFDGEELSAHLL